MNIKAGQIWRYRKEFLSGSDERYTNESYLFLVKMVDYNDIDEQFWEVIELGEYGGTNHLWISNDNPELTFYS